MTTKNKQKPTSKKSPSSTKIHKKSPKSTASRLARSKKFSRLTPIYARRTILTVIALAMMAVVLALLFTSLSTPERVISRTVESLAKDYYENYYYDRLGKTEKSTPETSGTASETEKSAPEILSRFSVQGLAPLSLRQLLYFDNDRHIDEKSSLEAYCDLDATSVKIYPEEPFSKSNYHLVYDYSCAF